MIVKVDRLVYHGCTGLRVQNNDLSVYTRAGEYCFVYSKIKNLEVQIEPMFGIRGYEFFRSLEREDCWDRSIGLFD